MKDIFDSLINTPIPTILIIFGLILLLLAIGVQLKTTIVTTNVKPSVAGAMGVVFLVIGLALNSSTKFVKIDESKIISRNSNQKENEPKSEVRTTSNSFNVTYKEGFPPSGKKKFRYRYVDQELNGETLRFDESGYIDYKYRYEKGLLNGEAVRFDEQGNIISKWVYEDGVLIGGVEQYKTGEKKTQFRFLNGMREGVSIGYFKNGKRRYEWLYKSGKLNGGDFKV